MIPKIIHYTWFSNDPFPDSVKDCMASWRQWLPEYEFRLWDMASLEQMDSIFLKEALSERKWAFAADFVRLYAVYNFGGIYLDTDVMIYKSFDSLLNQQAFIGRENSVHIEGRKTESYLTSHCFGAEKNHSFIGRCLHYYDNRHFKTSDDSSLPISLKFDTKLLPYIQNELAHEFGYDSSLLMNDVQHCDCGLTVFPSYYFDCVTPKDGTFCRHLALGSWRDKKTAEPKITLGYKIKWRIEALIRKCLEKYGYLMIEKR